MPEITRKHELFLVKAAKWIKAHGNPYCPKTAVKHISNWRILFKDLVALELVRKYKGGETIEVTREGWDYLSRKYPDITRRHAGRIRLE